MDEINVKNILEWLTDMVKEKRIMDAHTWVDTAQKLNILLGEEHDKLFDLEQKIAIIQTTCIEGGKKISECKVMMEATDTYKQVKKQKALISQVTEAIRIAKLQARLKSEEMSNY